MALGISESGWKAFVKKQKLAVELDDKELLKALARFDKSDERKPELRLEALKELTKEVPRQVTALLKQKKQLGDKPFGLVKDELYAILEEAEALQKKAQAAVDAAGEEDEEDDEESAPSALMWRKRFTSAARATARMFWVARVWRASKVTPRLRCSRMIPTRCTTALQPSTEAGSASGLSTSPGTRSIDSKP
jgi:hypothetical protein